MSDKDSIVEEFLGPRRLERLYYGAMKLRETEQHSERERRLQAAFIIVSGLLTMRAATIQHVREAWIDWDRGELLIPKLDACACRRCWIEALNKWLRDGFNDLEERGFWEDYEGIEEYGDCNKKHKQLIKKNADISEETLLEYVYKQYQPKTEKSVRRIPFGFSRRATAVYAKFFDTYDCFKWSQQHIRNLINDAAEKAPGLSAEDIFPHQLRSDGITMFARLLPQGTFVRDIAGHKDIRVSNEYIRQLGRITTYQAYDAAGKKEEAPPVIPENKGAHFPVLLYPQPFIGEYWDPEDAGTESQRHDRAAEKEGEKMEIKHPRAKNIPDKAGMPSRIDDRYDADDHVDELPVDLDELNKINLRYSRNSTLSEVASNHDIHSDCETEQFRYDRSDDDSLFTNQPNAKLPIGILLSACGDLVSKIFSFVDEYKPNRVVKITQNSIAQIAQGIANYTNPDHPAQLGHSELSKLAMFVTACGMLPIGVGRATVPEIDAWIIVIGAMILPLFFYPWSDLSFSNAFPVTE